MTNVRGSSHRVPPWDNDDAGREDSAGGGQGGPAGAGFMATTINDYMSHERKVPDFSWDNSASYSFAQNKNEYYPIPQSQLGMSQGKMKQNPGY